MPKGATELMATLQKKEIIAGLTSMTSLNDSQAVEVYRAFPKLIEKALIGGAKVQIVGFGTFETRQRKAHEAVNPGTREKVQVPEKRVPAFKASTRLKQALL